MNQNTEKLLLENGFIRKSYGFVKHVAASSILIQEQSPGVFSFDKEIGGEHFQTIANESDLCLSLGE